MLKYTLNFFLCFVCFMWSSVLVLAQDYDDLDALERLHNMTPGESRQHRQLLDKAEAELGQAVQNENGEYALDLVTSPTMAGFMSFLPYNFKNIRTRKRLKRLIRQIIGGDVSRVRVQLISETSPRTGREQLSLNRSSVRIYPNIYGSRAVLDVSVQQLFENRHAEALNPLRVAFIAEFPNDYLRFLNTLTDTERQFALDPAILRTLTDPSAASADGGFADKPKSENAERFVKQLHSLRNKPYFAPYFQSEQLYFLLDELERDERYQHIGRLDQILSDDFASIRDRMRTEMGEVKWNRLQALRTEDGGSWRSLSRLALSGQIRVPLALAGAVGLGTALYFSIADVEASEPEEMEEETDSQVNIQVVLTEDQVAEYQERIDWQKAFLLRQIEERPVSDIGFGH